MSEDIRGDKEFAKQAISSYPGNDRYIGKELKKDKELQDLKFSFGKNKKLILEIAGNRKHIAEPEYLYSLLDVTLSSDKDFMRKLVKKNPGIFYFIRKYLACDLKILKIYQKSPHNKSNYSLEYLQKLYRCVL